MYAFGRMPSASNEDLLPEESVRVDHDYTSRSDVSEGVHKYVYGMILRGMAGSLSQFMKNKGMDPNDIAAKKVELANMFKASGEASDWMVDIAKGDSPAAEPAVYFDGPDPCCDGAECCGWGGGYYYNILTRVSRSTRDELAYSFEKLKSKMDENAIAIIGEYLSAMDAFYKARDKYNDLCNDVAVECMHDIVMRFGDNLSKICPEWYTDISTHDSRSFERLVEKRKANAPTGEVVL